MSTDEPVEPAREENLPHESSQRPRVPLPILIGAVLGIALAFFLARQFLGDSTPALTDERLREAMQRWKAAGIDNYRVVVEVESRQRETYEVEVEQGQPQQAQRNGQPLKHVRAFDTWTIPGMFVTMGDDLSMAQRRSQGPGGTSGSPLTLRCQFDERTGAPLVYRRIEWGQDLEISWRITRFDEN